MVKRLLDLARRLKAVLDLPHKQAKEELELIQQELDALRTDYNLK